MIFFHKDIHSLYDDITSFSNILRAWSEFLIDKKRRSDVLEFSANMEENLISLHNDLVSKKYQHGGYTSFVVNDPKRRIIHKASVRDRLLHHVIHRVLYPYFNKKFIFDSFSSRKLKGTHVGRKRFRDFVWKLSRNRTKTVWILKVDIKKYFDSINHQILIDLLQKSFIYEPSLLSLLSNVINSFSKTEGTGIPLGNLTSQLFSNIYLNPLDHYAKRILKIKYYIRYADDIVILSDSKGFLENTLLQLQEFVKNRLKLSFHRDKISIQPWHKGVDMLGFVSFPHKTIMRQSTKKRMLKKILRCKGLKQKEQENALYSRMKFERL